MSAPECIDSVVLHGCPRCGQPLDALSFDESKIEAWTPGTREIVLARFDLPIQYCGVLESLSQFTDLYAGDPRQVSTPSVQWRLLIDRNPAAPYLDVRWILNPWGECSPSVPIRLSAGARVELIARRVLPPNGGEPAVVGGRITGRYWYDQSFGAPRGERNG